ncbi:transglycosylase SLT domain-containing protein [Phyllobacterium sp. UNC302MFCol5.2]|uniref:transglycosylase SLT domain-containing protein n=1 Tax=Phyllobacterium sp. UNC302MFCol5.2 TaxID=1449065 RepID=UPI000483D26D|nr:transglycosylase SLT domain-containing protein [Phyllobacterium sp. UNC302MFCol5.2]
MSARKKPVSLVLKATFHAVWLSSLLAIANPASSENLCEREMHRASGKYGIPLGILYAVGLTETGHKESLQPYAMNIDGTPYFMPSAAAAAAKFAQAQMQGAKLIDLGCMQINQHYHADAFPSVAAMLDPKANVDYAARFLKGLRSREGSWTMAVARYHAGPNNDPAQQYYVCRVIENMVASGFGNWTSKARQFCGKNQP